MRIVFLGSGEFGYESLRWLAGSAHEVVQVITQPARRAGRGRKVLRTCIARLAGELDLPWCESENVNAPAMTQRIGSLRPELLLVIAFGQKIGPALLNMPNCRAINLHGSLLPKYRGAAPINWAIINGEKQTGLTVIEMNEAWDAGRILGQSTTEILPGETAGELHDRLAQLGPQLLAEVLEKIEKGTVIGRVQDEKPACRAPKLSKADGALRWDQSAGQIRNRIHGMWPWPGAYCYLQQAHKDRRERVTIARAQSVPSTGSSGIGPSAPGTVAEDLTIICGRERLRLLQVRPDNGRLMAFEAFVNGRRLQSGDRFLDG